MSSSTSSASSISTTTISASSSIASFNRGPVTAQFTLPKSCLSTLTFGTDMYFGHRSIGYADGACYPASTTDRGLAGWDIYYYSPAQCPSGWTGARTATSTFGRDRTYLSLGKETTAVVCCPRQVIFSVLHFHF
ncbi:hypothetical protein BGZ60DRAFT_216181 [Tricladium varicosporioides]|nr:hypothetical protein BGZ60DRAFT_216181 [Hymenoscyphus varicosporioides]